MGGWLKARIDGWRQARRQRQEDSLALLRDRYEIFRALLDDNNRCLTLLTGIGARLRADAPGRMDAGLAREVAEMLTASGAMVEKLAILDDGLAGLQARHQRLAADIRGHLAGVLPAAGSGERFILPLAEIRSDADRSLVGGKAAALARLAAQGRWLVPAGFAVPVHACRLFLDEGNLLFRLTARLQRCLRQGDNEALAAEVEQAQREILAAPLPEGLKAALIEAGAPFLGTGRPAGLAVRSSAVSEDSSRHSFAGQYSSVLNVTTPAGLIQAFKEVVASSFTSRNLSYRLHAGLDPCAFDLAVLCVGMVAARCAGIMLTVDPNFPEAGRMLVSAVFGLGELAVSGRVMADIYYPPREGSVAGCEAAIALKEQRLVCRSGAAGGVIEEPVPPAEQQQPALSEDMLGELTRIGLEIEKGEGCPQDVEWAVDGQGRLFILQARPYRLARRSALAAAQNPAEMLISGGRSASAGTATGQVRVIRRSQDLVSLPDGPVILVLHQSLVDAAGVLPRVRAVLVDLGNPADHLSNVAREYGLPMITGLGQASRLLADGEWVTVEADGGWVRRASEGEIETAERIGESANRRIGEENHSAETDQTDPRLAELRRLIVPLNLTDAYGPTFSILECRSIHDVVRFAHEKAVLALFSATDEALEKGGGMVRVFESELRFMFSIIDLGGGLLERQPRPKRVSPDDIASRPMLALWRGMSTPGLTWGPPPGAAGTGAAVSNWLTDQKSARPLGMPNYAVITRDYLNLNARMDYHFIMVDAVCGLESRSNYLTFRFKGGGTSAARRKRRVACIAEVLETLDFFTDVREDLLFAKLQAAPQEVIEEKLEVVGRLLGFTRLLDSAMHTDEAVHSVARAFLEGDYGLSGLGSDRSDKSDQSDKSD